MNWWSHVDWLMVALTVCYFVGSAYFLLILARFVL
jgi:hypothetical protein